MGRRWSPFPVALSRTPAEAARPRIQGYCIAWYARLLPSFCWYSLTDPRGMASWVGVGTQQLQGGIRTHNLAVASPAPYHTATAVGHIQDYFFHCCKRWRIVRVSWELTQLAVSVLFCDYSSLTRSWADYLCWYVRVFNLQCFSVCETK